MPNAAADCGGDDGGDDGDGAENVPDAVADDTKTVAAAAEAGTTALVDCRSILHRTFPARVA